MQAHMVERYGFDGFYCTCGQDNDTLTRSITTTGPIKLEPANAIGTRNIDAVGRVAQS